MSATNELIDTLKMFKAGIRELKSGLICAKLKAEGTPEEVIAKRLEELNLFSAKKKLLRASTLSSIPEIVEQSQSPDLMQEYGTVVLDKVLEQRIVKSIMQVYALKKIVQIPNSLLSDEKITEKEKVIKAITDYIVKETSLRSADKVLFEKEAELIALQKQWYEKMGEMREVKENAVQEETDGDQNEEEELMTDVMFKFVRKLRVMCLVAQKFATGRSNQYDWHSDPHGRLAVIKESRDCLVNFLESL